MEPLPHPPLPCPECKRRAHESTNANADPQAGHRIGNRRNRCETCNNFVAAVARQTQKRMQQQNPEIWAQTKLQVEMDLYPRVIEKWTAQNFLSTLVSEGEVSDHG